MDCSRVRALISQYVERELAPEDQGPVEGHLRVCTACSSEVEAFKKMLSELKGLPQPSVPAGFRESVWNRIDALGGVNGATSATRSRTPDLGSRLRRWILEPWYWKLPIGAMATAAVALLVVQVTKETAPLMNQPIKMKYNLDKGRGAFSKREQAVPETQPPRDINAGVSGGALKLGYEYRTELPAESILQERVSSQAEAPPARRQGIVTDGFGATQDLSVNESPAPSRGLKEEQGNEKAHRDNVASVYYFRCPTADRTAAQQQIAQILAEISSFGELPVQEVKPGPSLYHLTMSPSQFTLFMNRILKWEKVEVRVLGQLPPGFQTIVSAADDQPGYAVILELVPSEGRGS